MSDEDDWSAFDAAMKRVLGEHWRKLKQYARFHKRYEPWLKGSVSWNARRRASRPRPSRRNENRHKLAEAYNKLRGQTGREHPKLKDIAREAGVKLRTAQRIGLQHIASHADELIAK